VLVSTFAALTALFAAAALIHSSGSPLEIVLGLPLQTTLFVWVIWPLGGVQLEGSRLVSGGLLLVSALFALYMDNLVALLGTFGWGTFAAAIVPSAAIGFNWKRATAAACVSSASLSVVLNFSLELLARHGIYKLPHGIVVGALSLLVSLVVFIVVSFWTGDKEGSQIPPHVKAVMEA